MQAAQITSRADPRMKELHNRNALWRGENKAMIGAANKMAIIIWNMLTKEHGYHQEGGALQIKA